MAADAPSPAPRSIAFVALAAIGMSGLTAWHSLGVYLPTLNTPHTSLEGVPHPPTQVPTSVGLARRLTVFVIDGLSYDAARSLEAFAPLRRQGALRPLAVDFPSYTSPALTSFVTGLGPRDSGTRRNGRLGGVAGLDSLLAEAAEAKVPVGVWSRGFDDFARLVMAPPAAVVKEGKLAPGVEIGVRGLSILPQLDSIEGTSPAREIDFFYDGDVDHAGHGHGGASPEYRKAAEDSAAFVARYAATLDLEQDSLVVVSDHGHLPQGGHGGPEPEVRRALFLGVGGFFRAGVELGERPLRDVASTLAVVAGVRVPTSNLGLPMLDALKLDDEQTSFLLAAPFDQAARFTCALQRSERCAEIDPLVPRLRKPDPKLWPDAEELYAALGSERDAALARRRAEGGPVRLIRAAAAEVLLLVIGWFALQRRVRLAGGLRPAAALLPLVNAGIYAGYMGARSYLPTFSVMRPAPTFIADAVPAVVLGAAAVGLLGWRFPPGRLAPWLLLVATALPFALLAAWVGWDPVTLPPPVAGILVFQLAPAVIGAALGAQILALVEARRAST